MIQRPRKNRPTKIRAHVLRLPSCIRRSHGLKNGWSDKFSHPMLSVLGYLQSYSTLFVVKEIGIKSLEPGFKGDFQ